MITKIKSLLTKLLVIIAAILIAMVVIYWGGSTTIFGVTFSAWQLGLLAVIAFGLAYIIDGKQASKMIGSIGNSASELVSSATAALGKSVASAGTAVATGVSGWILPVGLLLGGYLLIKEVIDDNKE